MIFLILVKYLFFKKEHWGLNDDKCLEKNKDNFNLIAYELESTKNKFFILENIKIKLLGKDEFLKSIQVYKNILNFFKDLALKLNNDDISVLFDIIKIIDFNIDSLIDKNRTNKNMIKFYKNSIMTTLKSLEKNRNFEFLYLCILLIISRMRDDIDNYNNKLNKVPCNESNNNLLLENKEKEKKNLNNIFSNYNIKIEKVNSINNQEVKEGKSEM